MRALERGGFAIVREESSHVVMKRLEPPARVVVPDHKFIKPGMLRAIMRDAGLSREEFLALLASS
jgi:predicted RNA binding protein YcfA (HicA-like mRNA interferase family)